MALFCTIRDIWAAIQLLILAIVVISGISSNCCWRLLRWWWWWSIAISWWLRLFTYLLFCGLANVKLTSYIYKTWRRTISRWRWLWHKELPVDEAGEQDQPHGHSTDDPTAPTVGEKYETNKLRMRETQIIGTFSCCNMGWKPASAAQLSPS